LLILKSDARMAVKFEEAELKDKHSDSFSAHDSQELNVSCKIKMQIRI
jgi:hypothetical protein